MMRRKKHLGQHFLSNSNVLNAEAVLIPVGSKVLEIGGGDGRLSERLARRASELHIVEKDIEYAELLRAKFSCNPHVHIINADFLDVPPGSLEVDYIIGNIPYYISSQITFRLLDWKFKRAYIMYQKEFAAKLIAKGNKRSRMSFFASYYFNIKRVFNISRSMFSPMPKVDSTLMEISIRNARRLDLSVEEFITNLFQYRLKSIRATLNLIIKQKSLNSSAEDLCRELGMDCSKRVFELDEAQIIKLGKKLSSLLP